jgi:hypothetical protein
MDNKEFFEKCDRAEKWFYESEHGKGKIAGFVPMLMAEYAEYYHECEVEKLNIPVVSGQSELLRDYFKWHKEQGYVSHKDSDIDEFLASNSH